jgi:hypothetical protein
MSPEPFAHLVFFLNARASREGAPGPGGKRKVPVFGGNCPFPAIYCQKDPVISVCYIQQEDVENSFIQGYNLVYHRTMETLGFTLEEQVSHGIIRGGGNKEVPCLQVTLANRAPG